MPDTTAPLTPELYQSVSFREALKVWMRVALLSFGGPAGQIAVMHRLLVDEKKWVSEQRFLHALNYCMVLPGPEAQQLAIYLGWLMHGTKGGLAAGTLFVLPGFLSILVLSLLYAGLQQADWVQALFFGIKAAVLAVVIQAVIKIGKRALKNQLMYALAACAFVAIFFFAIPFPLVIIAAGGIGLLHGYLQTDGQAQFKKAQEDQATEQLAAPRPIDRLLAENHAHTAPSIARALKVTAIWLPLWFVPIFGLTWLFGLDDVFVQIGWFFSKLAVVTFGGAYSVLAYMAQEAVQNYGWLTPGEMLDGLGMAESTPGPLIQVVQFVAFMGAFREAGGLDPFLAGLLASVLATWVTFVPCFYWIFLGAPYVESLRGNRLLNAALSTITAAVVGVMLNLAIWFAVHVAFGRVGEWRFGGASVPVPELASVEPGSVLIALGSLLAMLRFKVGMLKVLGVSAAIGFVYHLLRGAV